ncbi:hypothetical protein COOONC_17909 [Cooperia oncophora]
MKTIAQPCPQPPGAGEPEYPLLPDAQFLKHNPLLDYHDHNADSGEGALPVPENVMFPGAMTADPRTAGSDDDDGQFFSQ